MKTTIALKGIHFYAFHGYYEEERKMGNDFVIDAEVEVKSFDEADDNISDTVNYEKIYAICSEEMSIQQKLLETVVFRICKRLEELKHVKSGKVSLAKIGPQLGGKVDKAQVEMSF